VFFVFYLLFLIEIFSIIRKYDIISYRIVKENRGVKVMKMKVRVLVLSFVLIVGLFMPKCVSAKEIDGFNFKDGTFINYGDIFNFGENMTYNCGGGKECSFAYKKDYLNLYVDKIIYPDGSKKLDDRYLDKLDVYNDGEYKMKFPDYQEMLNLLKYYYDFNDSYADALKMAKISVEYISDYDYDNWLYGISITIDMRKQEYKINYNNIYGVQNDNPIMYTIADGSITLKDISHKNLKFAGWYLDADYKTKVDTISSELFSEISNNGTLQLYAKWEGELKLPDIINPQTSFGKIFIPTILVIICMAVSYFVLRKHEKN